jgi:hypothetical protein
MLFFILVVLAIIGIVWVIYDEFNLAAMFLTITMILLNVISIAVLICSNVGVDGYIASNQVRYETLIYQYENDVYDNDNDLGKRELMTDIQNWNEDLAKYKATQDDFWIGIYIPNIYDQFEFIELK